MPPVPFKRKHEQISDYYDTLITEGRIPPGTRLPGVDRIASTWNVGRNCAHLAIRELQHRGKVEIRGRAGTYAVGGTTSRNAAR